MRPAADFEMPNSGASWRIVKFVRQYVVTSSTRSSSGRLHGRPLRTSSAPSRRSIVTNLLKQRGLSPVNGVIHAGCVAVITAVTAGSFQTSPRAVGNCCVGQGASAVAT